MDQIKLLTATAGLTLLIWAAAEQMVTGSAELSVQVSVQAPANSNMVVTPVQDASAKYRIEVKGRQTVIDDLNTAAPSVLTMTIAERQNGSVDLQLIDELRQLDLPELRGATVESVDPPTMRVQIDRWIIRPMPVSVRPGNLDYDVAPAVEPDVVEVTILETEFERIRTANPRVELDAETYLRDKAEGVPHAFSVPLQGLVQSDQGSVNITIKPNMVTLRATLRHQRMTATIQAVPIQFRGSWSSLNRFEIEFRDPNPIETISIRVVGPPEMIDQLISGKRKTFAVVTLGTADAGRTGQFQFFRPEFVLPAGVSLADDFTPPAIELRLVPRQSSAHDANGD